MATVVAIVSLLLVGAGQALADQHEVECYSCHADGSQGAAGELKPLPVGHPAADAAKSDMPSTGILLVVPAAGLLALGAGLAIYRKG